MKRFLLAILTVLAAANINATTFTFSSTNQQTKDGITVSFSIGNGQAEPKMYDNGLRLYANNTITISGANLSQISISFAKQGKNDYATLSASIGNLKSGGESTSSTEIVTDTWTGNASSVVFTLGGKGQRIITKIVVGENVNTDDDDDDNGGNKDDDETIININGMVYADASYFTYDDEGWWAIDLYKDYDEDAEDYIYPEVYFEIPAKSATALNGTYICDFSGYWISTNDSIMGESASATIKYVSESDEDYTYNISLTMLGEDGKTYKVNGDFSLVAFDYDNFEYIWLTDNNEEGNKLENKTSSKPTSTKLFQNGQIIIRNNGKDYNVLGIEL